jgi:hypothetical protein
MSPELLDFFLKFLEGCLLLFILISISEILADLIEGTRLKYSPKRLHFAVLIIEVNRKLSTNPVLNVEFAEILLFEV